jgi:hypothetical protein
MPFAIVDHDIPTSELQDRDKPVCVPRSGDDGFGRMEFPSVWYRDQNTA